MNNPKPSAEQALAIAMQKLNEQGQYILKLEGGIQAYQLLLKEIDKPKEVKEDVKK